MRLWVCIPVFNRLALTVRCLESLAVQDCPDYRIVLCDDGSTDGTSAFVRERYPEVVVLEGDGNLWWTGATNRCIEYVLGQCKPDDAIVTLNNDLEVESDYLSELSRVAQCYPGALIGSAAYDIHTGDLVDPGFRHSWWRASARRLDPVVDHLRDDPSLAAVTHLPGRGTLIPISVLHVIGLFDFKRLPQYGADYDLSFRAARRGYPIFIAYRAKVLSHVDETGLTEIRRRMSIGSFLRYLTNRRSPANLGVRFWLGFKNCPRGLLPWYLLADLTRTIGGYFLHHLRGQA